MLFISYSNPIFQSLAWTMVHSLWQFTIIAIVIGVVLSFIQNRSSSQRYNLLLGGTILMVVSSLITFFYILVGKTYTTNSASTEVVNPEIIPTINQLSSDVTTAIVNQSDYSLYTRLNTYIDEHISLILGIWLFGIMIAVFRLFSNIIYIQYIKSNMTFEVDEFWGGILEKIKSKFRIQKDIGLMESAYVRSPVVFGHIKPLILFPIGAINKLNPEQVEAILAHELAHIMRNDYIINIILTTIESIFYYHPAIWWISNQLKIEREHSCDDIAIKHIGDKLEYAKSLVALQEIAISTPQLSLAFAGQSKSSQMVKRVSRLFIQNTRAISVREKGIAMVSIFVLLGALTLISRSTSVREECLPSENQLSSTNNFIKFNDGVNIDSFEIDFSITDGKYELKDDLYKVNLEIKGNYVTNFNINGLNVADKDLPKFKDLIYKTLSQNKTEFEEVDDPLVKLFDSYVKSLKDGKYLKNGSVNVLIVKEDEMFLNGRKLNYDLVSKFKSQYKTILKKTLNSNNELEMTFEFNNNVPILLTVKKLKSSNWDNLSGFPMEHEVYDDLIESLRKDQLLGEEGDSYSLVINPDEMIINDEPVDDKWHKKYLELFRDQLGKDIKDGEKFTFEMDDEGRFIDISSDSDFVFHTPPFIPPSPPSSPLPHAPDSPLTPPTPPGYDPRDAAYNEWLAKDLFAKGYIFDKLNFNFYLSPSQAKANGKKISEEDHQRYLNTYEKMTGVKVTKNFTKTLNYTNN
jgi:beta-lactamase regulating signal transducer with metallopeptidase domain